MFCFGSFRVWRIEFFVSNFDFGVLHCPEGCTIVSVGWFGFAWLRGRCRTGGDVG